MSGVAVTPTCIKHNQEIIKSCNGSVAYHEFSGNVMNAKEICFNNVKPRNSGPVKIKP